MRRNPKEKFEMPLSFYELRQNSAKVVPLDFEVHDDLEQPKAKKLPKKKNYHTSSILKKALKKTFRCQICLQEYPEQKKLSVGKCSHYYCEPCLESYTIHKISIYEQVVCPNEDCQHMIDPKGQLYLSLPRKMKTKYQQMCRYYKISKDENTVLCPAEKCREGVLHLSEENDPKCNKCKRVFCRKCLYPKHEGECQKSQLNFLKNNLKYHQCRRCKNIIERSVGCNHMTCRCGHQFCYICGKDWLGADHLCDEMTYDERCCCVEGSCCSEFGRIFLKGTVYAFLFLLYLLKELLLFLGVLGLLLLISLFSGITYYTIKQFFGKSCGMIALMIIFFPLVIIVGLGQAFKLIFLYAVGDYLGEPSRNIRNACNRFFYW